MLDKMLDEGARKFKAEFEPVFNNVVKKIDDIARSVGELKGQLNRIEAGLEELRRR
jgi:hypothetical protein